MNGVIFKLAKFGNFEFMVS